MLAILLSFTAAQADQCAWIPKATAEAAVKYLQPQAEWASYCEPCGDSKPTYGKVVEGAQIRTTSAPDLWEVVVDGKAVDLAYVFVLRRPSDNKLGNLAFLTGCPTSGVSKTIARKAP
jgi:hypothetical protein